MMQMASADNKRPNGLDKTVRFHATVQCLASLCALFYFEIWIEKRFPPKSEEHIIIYNFEKVGFLFCSPDRRALFMSSV